MAYQNGAAANPAALKSTIETFAQANGYIVTAGIISDGWSSWRLTSEDEHPTLFVDQRLRIEGAKSADFTTDIAPRAAFTWVDATQWPVVYYLFAHSSPRQIVCVINYNNVYFQYVAFGQITKYGSWGGGNWFGASLGYAYTDPPTATTGTHTTPGLTAWGGYTQNYFIPAPFWSNLAPADKDVICHQRAIGSFLYCDIDGHTWPGGDSLPSDPNATADYLPTAARWAKPLHISQPNTFNSQTTLVPWRLFMGRPDNKFSIIGELANVRILRIDNYNTPDVIQLGSDQWMPFPLYRKVAGSQGGATHSGVYGWAIKKT